MVKETRQIFDLSDVKAIRLRCEYCKAEVVQEILAYKIPGDCPLCGHRWETPRPDGSMGPNRLLVRAIQDILRTEYLPVTVRFEIEGGEIPAA